ncbi:30S ribosomal protein S16 [bacterium]|nr:30S ribosomal protein S16 [bacterium]
MFLHTQLCVVDYIVLSAFNKDLRRILCMAVKIRLSRVGKKKAPIYKIVAVHGRNKRDGEYLENLGTYNPLTGDIIQFHAEKLNDWISKGAQPTDTVKRITQQYKRKQAAGTTTPVVKKAKPVAPKVQEAAAEAVVAE